MVKSRAASNNHYGAKNPHVLHTDDSLEDAVQNAERSFVLKDYKRALKLSVDVLSAENDMPSRNDPAGCVCLTTSLDTGIRQEESPGGEFTIRMTPDISLLDRAAVVALQGAYELSSDTGRTAFVDYYRRRPMPLDVSVVWMQFLFRTDHEAATVELAAELLHYARQYPSVSESTDELLSFLLTEVLPFSTSVDLVRDILDRIQTSSWVPSPLVYAKDSTVNEEAVSMLLSRLDMISFSASLDHCRRHLKSLTPAEEALQDHNEEDVSDCSGALADTRTSQASSSWTNIHVQDLYSKDFYLNLSKRLLNLFRIHVVRPLSSEEGRWEHRRNVVISALLLYLAWKKRRRLLLVGTSASAILTSPFREIMEALLPQARR
jgi:hypothetical protein